MPNTKISYMSPDGGTTKLYFTDEELTAKLTPTDIKSQITSPSQGHYIVNLQNVIRYGDIVEIIASVESKDITSYPVGTAWTSVKANFPNSYGDGNLETIIRGDSSSNPIQVQFNASGTMNVRGGTAGASYNIHYIYVCNE